jgi:hypothetical protein
MKTTETTGLSPRLEGDERVIAIEVNTPTGPPRRLYAIRDINLDYWRGTSALEEYDAWTRDTSRRATFDTRAEAERELAAIWESRRSAPPCMW